MATLAGPASMCTAFVNGIDETNPSATSPCTHQLTRWASSAAPPSKPMPMKACPTAQPTGDHVSNDGSVSAIRNASSRKPVSARKKRIPRNARSPST